MVITNFVYFYDIIYHIIYMTICNRSKKTPKIFRTLSRYIVLKICHFIKRDFLLYFFCPFLKIVHFLKNVQKNYGNIFFAVFKIDDTIGDHK
jgi:hypothetical protein